MEMNHRYPEENRLYLPHLGQRIIKTTIAVFICLAIYALRGYKGDSMPTEAAITAIICMQHDVHDTGRFAFDRFFGTLIGIFWSISLLLVLTLFPALGHNPLSLHLSMALGVLLSLYSAVVLQAASASSLAAIVFLCIVISFPDIDAPFHNAAMRVLDVFIGTVVAILVNIFRLPRRKNPNDVFFVHTKDLVPDRFAQISPAVLFRLNYLYNDGAKICLMSEHAPAFFTGQMNSVKLSVPLIVMDGAGIYDANEDRYLWTHPLAEEASLLIRKTLDEHQISYFMYTVHNNRTCIFHHGEVCDAERTVYNRMRRSPYRHYLEGEVYHTREIVYFKIIGGARMILLTEKILEPLPPVHSLRTVRRYQVGTNEIIGLYIYSGTATKDLAAKKLMDMLRKEDPSLEPVEFRLRFGYQSEHDALNLLHRLGNVYEPVRFLKDPSVSGIVEL